MTEAVVRRRCDRNRKRSKRRAIYCPHHGCQIDSVSQKYALYTESAEQLRERGVARRNALLLVANQTTVRLDGEWIEAFWCDQCQATTWYHVRKGCDRNYTISSAPKELWEQAAGVIHPRGNPSVSEFTHRQARMIAFSGVKDFRFIN